MPSRGVSAPTAAHKTIVSPYRITHDPSACLATRPISTVRSRSPTRIDSLRYFLTVIFVRLLLTTPALEQARNVSSAALWIEWWSAIAGRHFRKALTSQRTPKKEKATEPGREALAAFGFCKAARVAWLPKSPSRSARAQALR